MPQTPMDSDEIGKRFFGKYRGAVIDNKDPTGSGKLYVTVPNALGPEEVWAAPCVPYADKNGNGLFMIPPNQSSVWIEFVEGDPSEAVWTGFEWPKGGAPSASPDEMVVKTPSGTLRFNVNNTNGDVTLETETLSLVLRDDTVTLTASSTSTIKMKGNKTAINGTGLEVE